VLGLEVNAGAGGLIWEQRMGGMKATLLDPPQPYQPQGPFLQGWPHALCQCYMST
jgi:hypothetical protein